MSLITARSLQSSVCQGRSRIGTEKEKDYEIRFLAEANLTPQHFARFSHASRQRLSGAVRSWDVAPRLRSGPRTRDVPGRPARIYARLVQHLSHGNANAC